MHLRDQNFGRRRFLLGSAAAAGTLLAGRPALAAASVHPGRPPAGARQVSPGVTAGIYGATVNPGPYGSSNWLTGAQTFDSYVDLPLATSVQKIYMTQGEFYTAPLPAHITSLASAGCQFIFCVYPSATTGQSAQLAQFLELLTSSGLVYQVALVNEWNRYFATPQAYLTYWSQYAPVVQAAGVPLASLVCATSTKSAYAKIQPGFPASPAPDAYWIDYYATAYYWGIRLDTPGGLIDQAQAAGVPVGIAEFGWGAGGGNKISLATWQAYTSYLSELAPSMTLGCLYWGSQGLDVVTGPADQKVPGIQQVVAAFQASGA